MKKIFFLFTITVLMVSLISLTAFAHGGNGSRVHQQSFYELCTLNSCNLLGPHQHNDTWYCSQTGRQSDYKVCTVEGCTQTGLHKHNGVYYRSANCGMGHGCGRAWSR